MMGIACAQPILRAASCCEFHNGDAHEVEIVDYHKG